MQNVPQPDHRKELKENEIQKGFQVIQIRECQYSDIVHLAGKAKRERSVLSDGKNHVWFMATSGDEIVGCSAAAIMKASEGRIKGTFVLKEHRGQGISKALNQACLDYLENKAMCSFVTAFVTTDRNLKWYLHCGFKIEKEGNGIAFVRKLL